MTGIKHADNSVYGKLLSFLIFVLLLTTPAHAQQIIPDGNTNTSLNTNGNVTNVSTTTIKGANAFNSFARFNVNDGNVVNLVIPGSSQRLINIVKNETSNINGVLNSIQNNKIGGNIYLVNPNGIVVGSHGVINVGSLTAITPTKAFTDNFFNAPGNPDEGSVNALINGTIPVNKNAVLDIAGKINAQNNINLTAGKINNTGDIKSNLAFKDLVNVNGIDNGKIVINTPDMFINSGKIISNASDITINSSFAGMNGEINSSGKTGGTITVNTETLSLANKILSTGTEKGGTVNLNVKGKTWEVKGSIIDVSGGTGGTINHIAKSQIITSGTYLSTGNNGTGGKINITAPELKFYSTEIDASGKTGGGYIQLGGEFQGGKELKEDLLPNAQNLILNNSTKVKADATGDKGNGGTIITWADKRTVASGEFSAQPGKKEGKGGFIEISGKEDLGFNGIIKAGTGDRAGSVLFDPKNIIIVPSDIPAKLMGHNYGDSITLSLKDYYGSAVALDGFRIAIGAPGDDGTDETGNNFGAVPLYTFSNEIFADITLRGVIGNGFSINLPLDNEDAFGSSVSLKGRMLAVGAPGDDGFNNTTPNSGAVYLYTFTDDVFGGGQLQAIIGNGYGGFKDIDEPLDTNNSFGTGVSLDGNRLAVGAANDGGNPNIADSNYGAVYLYNFIDSTFSGGQRQAIIGRGYTGGKNINASLDPGDLFGKSLSLDGNRLVVGAGNDQGIDNTNYGLGAVYMYTFTNTAFSGGQLQGIIGNRYTGGKNVHQYLKSYDYFANSVSLEGNILAVGAKFDDGYNDLSYNTGAVYVYKFNDNNFSGGKLHYMIGKGYVGGRNLDTYLDDNDAFGTSVSLDGNYLAVGSPFDDGLDNKTDDVINMNGDYGAVSLYIYSHDMIDGMFFNNRSNETVTLYNSNLESFLNSGLHVTLKASNDITVLAPITIDGSGILTLDAGRSILVKESISSSSSTINLIANDYLSSGVIDSQRDSGDAVITIDSDKTLNSTSSFLNLELRNGTGKTNKAGTDITLAGLTAGTVTVKNNCRHILTVDSENPPTINAYNINLYAPYGNIGTSTSRFILTDLTTGNLTASAPNGSVYIKENSGSLNLNFVTAGGRAWLNSKEGILDGKMGETPNIYANNIELTAEEGTIGGDYDDLNIYLNYNSINGVVKAEALGLIKLNQYEGDLMLDKIKSQGDVVLYSKRNILDATVDEDPNITGKNISLYTVSSGSIGLFKDSVDIYQMGEHLNAQAWGYIGINAPSDNINVNLISNGGRSNVKLTAAGKIMDNRPGEEPNIYANNIILGSTTGSVGLLSDDLNIYLNYNSTGGTLSVNVPGLIFIKQNYGNLMLNQVYSTAGDVMLSCPGNILDKSADENPNILGTNIKLVNVSTGSIGLYNDDVDINLNGGVLSTQAYGYIGIRETAGDMVVDLASNAGRANIKLTAQGSILDAANDNRSRIYTKGLTLISQTGNIGSAINKLDINLNYHTTGGTLYLNAPGSKNYQIHL